MFVGLITLLLSFLCLFYQNSHLSQAFQFFVPIGAGAGLHLPSSMFIGQTSDKRASPDLSADEQLACRWKKVSSRVGKSQLNQDQKQFQDHSHAFNMIFFPPSAICSLTPCKTWWIMSMTSMSSLKKTLGTAATGRDALAKGGGSMPGEKKKKTCT